MAGVLVCLLCAATWAIGSVTLRDLSKKLDPFTLSAPRTLAGGLAMLLLTLATGRTGGYRDVTPEHLFFLFASLLLGGGIGDVLYTFSLSRIGVSRAFAIGSTYPAFTLFLGVIFLQEEISLATIGGLVLVILGIIIVGMPPTNVGGTKHPLDKGGIALAVATSLFWGASMAVIAPGMKGLDPIMVASFRTPALSLVLWGIVGVRGTFPKLRELSGKEWVVMIAGGLVAWGLGSVLFLWSVELVGAARSAILTSTSPLFALPLSVIFLHEKINKSIVLGTVLMVLGVILVSWP